MLMTMAAEYKRNSEVFPNPERLEKVEDSMENLLDVVRERDTAAAMLETGEPPLPGRRRWAYNALGLGFWRKCREHHLPIHMNTSMRSTTAMSGPWQHKYQRLYRETKLRERRKQIRAVIGLWRANQEVFPGNPETEPDLERFRQTLSIKEMRGPQDKE